MEAFTTNFCAQIRHRKYFYEIGMKKNATNKNGTTWNLKKEIYLLLLAAYGVVNHNYLLVLS